MKDRKDSGYQFMRFVLTWTIFMHHILTTANSNGVPKPYIINGIFSRVRGGFGQMAVAMFFMLSGALLWKNHKEIDRSIKFILNHIVKLLLPLWIYSVPLILVDYMKNPEWVLSSYARKTVIFNFLGADLYLWIFKDTYPYHVCGEWFTSVIIILYLLYPILRKLFFDRKLWRWVGTVSIIAMYLINLQYKYLTMGNGWYSVTIGLFYFWIGMLFEEYKDTICNKHVSVICFGLFSIVYLFFNRSIFGSEFMPSMIASLCSFVIIYVFANMIYRFIDKTALLSIIEETCKNSYPIYLCHHFIIMLLMPLLLNQQSNVFQFLVFCIFVGFLCYCYSNSLRPVSTYLLKKIRSK